MIVAAWSAPNADQRADIDEMIGDDAVEWGEHLV